MNIDQIIIACAHLVEQYNKVKDKNASIDELLTILDKLSGYVFFIREAVGESESNYIILKTKYEAQKIREIKNAFDIEQKPVLGKIERMVEFNNLELIHEYRQAKAENARLKNITLGIERTIDAINNRINFYKFDYKIKQNS